MESDTLFSPPIATAHTADQVYGGVWLWLPTQHPRMRIGLSSPCWASSSFFPSASFPLCLYIRDKWVNLRGRRWHLKGCRQIKHVLLVQLGAFCLWDYVPFSRMMSSFTRPMDSGNLSYWSYWRIITCKTCGPFLSWLQSALNYCMLVYVQRMYCFCGARGWGILPRKRKKCVEILQ